MFVKLNNSNGSNLKAILNKEQTFCPPSCWSHSTFSTVFLRVNALLTTLLGWFMQHVSFVRLHCDCEKIPSIHSSPSNPMQLREFFVHVFSIFWSEEALNFIDAILARDLLDLPATKVLAQSKVRRIFYEKGFESSESLAIFFFSLSFVWYEVIHFF